MISKHFSLRYKTISRYEFPKILLPYLKYKKDLIRGYIFQNKSTRYRYGIDFDSYTYKNTISFSLTHLIRECWN